MAMWTPAIITLKKILIKKWSCALSVKYTLMSKVNMIKKNVNDLINNHYTGYILNDNILDILG